jgi:hypothetical protein
MPKGVKNSSIKVRSQLPSGFKAISKGGDSWIPKEVGDAITGTLVKVKSVHFDAEMKGKKIVRQERDVNVYTIHTKNGDVGVWESAGLKALQDVKKKQQVYIRFDGMGRAKPGQNAPRLYTVAVK